MAAEDLKLADAAPEHDAPAMAETPSEELQTGTEAAHDTHGAKPGLPQLDISTFASQLFWLLISFVILYTVISRVAAPKIGGVIQDRANRIKGDLETAAKAKRDSEAAIAGYEKALADARTRGLKTSDELRNKAQAEINAKNDAASKDLNSKVAVQEARIAEMRKAAMAKVGDVARETATDIVNKLTGEAANSNNIETAIGNALKRA